MGKLVTTMIEMLLETKKWREKHNGIEPPICTPNKTVKVTGNEYYYACKHLQCHDCAFYSISSIEQAVLELEEIRKIQAMHELIDVKNL